MIEIKPPSRSDTLDVFKQAKSSTINLLFSLACCFSAVEFGVMSRHYDVLGSVLYLWDKKEFLY